MFRDRKELARHVEGSFRSLHVESEEVEDTTNDGDGGDHQVHDAENIRGLHCEGGLSVRKREREREG
jgi:hypothetical protein